MKVKDIIEELSKFDNNLEVMFLIQDKKYHSELSCRKVYINTDADGNEVVPLNDIQDGDEDDLDKQTEETSDESDDDKGTETDYIKVNNEAEIVEIYFQKVGNHTWLTKI